MPLNTLIKQYNNPAVKCPVNVWSNAAARDWSTDPPRDSID
jgi:hypothetical protein